MVRNREEAAKQAEASTRNTRGMCQAWTRTMFDAPSVGDVDKDGDADAVDGWKAEPLKYRHSDRNPPRGVPVAWGGGARGHGHRAVSLGNGLIRTTDGKGDTYVATRSLDWPEKEWGLKYLGWTDTISGILIPLGPPRVTTRGKRVDQALALLQHAYGTGDRRKRIDEAIAAVVRIKPVTKR